MSTIHYRPDIDGLRAVAVIPVILFHSGLGLFPGGYVGVDIFFVISGYLVTSLIYRDITANKFSFLNFYERRARRILPALYSVLAITLIPAWLLLMPQDLVGYAENSIGTISFVSNIVLWLQSNYFDQAAELKPLLHTWSLAVEEQYYLFIPILLIVFFKLLKKYTIPLVILLMAISLVISHWGAINKPSATYYLLPTRAWELLLGSVVALLKYRSLYFSKVSESNSSNLISFIALTLIIGPMILYSKDTLFPGLSALPPTIGTVLLISFPNERGPIYGMLSSRLLVGIGLISYSAYLWHQPVFAFSKHQLWIDVSETTMIFGSIASLFLAYLSWRFIEQPFRDRKQISSNTIWWVSAAGAILLSTISGLLIAKNGFEGRFKLQSPLTSENFAIPTRSSGWCFYSVDTNLNLTVGKEGFDCLLGIREKPDVLLFGDSYAAMYEPTWDIIGKRLGLTVNPITTNWCFPSYTESFYWPSSKRAKEQCLKNREHVFENSGSYKLVVISSIWSRLEQKGLIEEVFELINHLTKIKQINVVIMPQPPMLRRSSVKKVVYQIDRGGLDYDKEDDMALAANEKLQAIAASNKRVLFITREELFGKNKKGNQTLTNDGLPYSWDGGHLSIYGGSKAGVKFTQSPGLLRLKRFIAEN